MITLIPICVLVGWNKVQEQQKGDGKAKLKISRCIHHFKMLWEYCSFCTDPARLWKEEHPTRELQVPDHLHVSRTLDISGSRVGKEMVWRHSRSKRTVGLHSQQNGTAIQRNWSSSLQKYQCFESWDLETYKGRSTIHCCEQFFP